MAWGDATEAVSPLKKPFTNTTDSADDSSAESASCGGCDDSVKTVTHSGIIECKEDGGKWYLFQTLHKYELVAISKSVCASDEVFGLKHLETTSVPFFPIPQLFKAPEEGDESCVLPDFNGFIEVFVDDSTEPVQVIGGGELPDNMIGAIACINGELCYFGSSPSEKIPDEVWCQETEPTDPNIELWIFNGISKVKNPEGKWVQTQAYGA